MTATLEVVETSTLYDHCAAWMERRSQDGTPIVYIGKMRCPETRSGDAVLVEMTDEQAELLEPGEVVAVWPVWGDAVVVRRVRPGAAYDSDGQPYEVPVVEVEPRGVYAVGDLLTVQLLEAA